MYSERVFVLLSGLLVQCQQPHTSAESRKKFFSVSEFVFVILGTERKAVQESYLLANLNDMFLQQNQTKKQWKWWRRRSERSREGAGGGREWGRRRGEKRENEESEWVNKNGVIGIINSGGGDSFFFLNHDFNSSFKLSHCRSDVAAPAATWRERVKSCWDDFSKLQLFTDGFLYCIMTLRKKW